MGFRMDGVLRWDLLPLQDALHLNESEVKECFTDGRRVSFLIERRLSRDVLGERLAASEGDDHDVLDAQGRKWEVRSLTKGGIYFCPSYMVGSGRSFEAAGFLRKLESIDAYAISDITKFPEIPYWFVTADKVRSWWESQDLGPSTKIGREKALRLLAAIKG